MLWLQSINGQLHGDGGVPAETMGASHLLFVNPSRTMAADFGILGISVETRYCKNSIGWARRDVEVLELHLASQ